MLCSMGSRSNIDVLIPPGDVNIALVIGFGMGFLSAILHWWNRFLDFSRWWICFTIVLMDDFPVFA